MRRLLLAALFLCGCAGGGDGGGNQPPPPPSQAEYLHWIQPAQFADNTPLDLKRDLLCYEIHKSDNTFCDNTIVAFVRPVDDNGVVTDKFDMALLAPFGVGPGPQGTYLTVRTIGIDNAQSEFGKPTFWEGRQ